MINNAPGFPVFEGPIPGVTIPFLGVQPGDGAKLAAAASITSFAANTIANPTFRTAAGFSSGGPRLGDSLLKPNVSAPGVSIFSTSVGTGNGGQFDSGTSMATPHVAGVAALVAQAHPKWPERALSAAVVETADPKALNDYTVSIEGAGLVQPLGATHTQAVVFAETDGGAHALSFGFEESLWNIHKNHDVVVHNYGDTPIVFNVNSTPASAVPHTVHLGNTSVFVPAHGRAEVDVSLTVPVGTVGATHDANGNDVFEEVAGYLTFTPATAAMNGGVTLNVPYYLVPRARSNLFALPIGPLNAAHPKSNILLVNAFGGVPGNADFYAWGLSGQPQGIRFYDTRAVGVQAQAVSATDRFVVFAINTFKRFSSPSGGEFDIFIDVNGDGQADFDLVGIDLGLLTANAFSGQYVSALVNLSTGTVTPEFLADAPTDGSSVLLPVMASDLGLSPANPRLAYSEMTTNLLDGTSEKLPGTAFFNVFTPAISNALFVPVAPNDKSVVPVAIDPAEFAKTPPLGLMVVVEDNTSGEAQASLIPVRGRH
jgi:hypothetical protein